MEPRDPVCRPPRSAATRGRARVVERRILRLAGRAIADFGMIVEGDRILVAVSGGKDSLTLLRVLRLLAARAPISFELLAAVVAGASPGFDPRPLVAHLEAEGVPHVVRETRIGELVAARRDRTCIPCAFCSRLRRGVLYTLGSQLGATKIALGHHADDLIETLLLNAFYSGQLKAMAPALRTDDGRHTVIRPLSYVHESDIAAYAEAQGLPVVHAACPLAEFDQERVQRRGVRALIADLEARNPGIRASLLASLRRVRLGHLLDPRHARSPAGPLVGIGKRC